jgi:hypothetical protein
MTEKNKIVTGHVTYGWDGITTLNDFKADAL